MYYVKFILRNDTKDYLDTNLLKWKEKIIKSVEEFNNKESRITDKATMNLIDVEEKNFVVAVEIDERFNPSTRSFYTRIGTVSRILKDLGMHEILSPHGKLFSLSVEGENEIDQTNILKNDEEVNTKTIYLDYKNKEIMIPKEMVEDYVIKFY
ncbi:hypothetical protein GKZ28_11090 [Clostridium chromiireducens]|uniref:Uncharacterized protein n=1 Tax=Clostridium chromiireducens TaxID=225345 RepID=A0A964RMI5_9CLOT|nr:hypothetical protein [Clostridium chromiireducens]MVX64235.1 hypothetical protein [Clostridium chromiireducens]